MRAKGSGIKTRALLFSIYKKEDKVMYVRELEKDLNKNSEGYNDPTAYQAIKRTDNEPRFHKLLNAIFNLCELSGYEVVGRIVLRDKKTGKIWR